MKNTPLKLTWNRADCAVFYKVKDAYGGLSNMAGGFPILVNGVEFRTSEALYQAMRFPDEPRVQEIILNEKSPMAAKMQSKAYRELTRPDWDDVRVDIMEWAIKAKLICNEASFGSALLETENRMIVEQSRKDDFWGAKEVSPDALVGQNVLGLLLTSERQIFKFTRPIRVSPPPHDLKLFGEPIQVIERIPVKFHVKCPSPDTPEKRKQLVDHIQGLSRDVIVPWDFFSFVKAVDTGEVVEGSVSWRDRWFDLEFGFETEEIATTFKEKFDGTLSAPP